MKLISTTTKDYLKAALIVLALFGMNMVFAQTANTSAKNATDTMNTGLTLIGYGITLLQGAGVLYGFWALFTVGSEMVKKSSGQGGQQLEGGTIIKKVVGAIIAFSLVPVAEMAKNSFFSSSGSEDTFKPTTFNMKVK